MAEPKPAATRLERGRDDPTAWVGRNLDWIGGGSGRVEGVLIDAEGAGPRWLVVQVARFGRHTAVPAEFAVGAGERVWVPLGRELLRSAPKVDAELGLDPAGELQLRRHYGIPAGVRRSPAADPSRCS